MWASLKRAVTLVVGLALLTVSPVVLAQSSSDAGSETTQPPRANADVTAPTSAEAENTPRWKFDVGVSISPLFGAFFDEFVLLHASWRMGDCRVGKVPPAG